MHSYLYQHRVRYRECDPMGIVYHTHYLDYFEAARTEALRNLGVSYREVEENGIIMPVVEAGIRYHEPANYDDLLDITAYFNEFPSARLPVDYTVRRHGEDKDLVTGHVTLCFIDKERDRPTRIPPTIRRVFEEIMPEAA